jgi:alpha-ribazole phosphatase/probable phosphoglycerate mutase
MVTTIYLIRHGETVDAEPRRYKGHIDVPLSEKGIEQMKRLAKYIVQNSSNSSNQKLNPPSPPFSKGGMGGFLNAVYCSDLIRAIKSAEIIAEPYGLKPIIMPELRERNFGIWEGMSFDEIKEKYPEEFDVWASNPLKFSPLQGESTIEVRDRVIDALNRILNEVQDSSKSFNIAQNSSTLNHVEPLNNIELLSIGIVSHGGVNRIVLCHLLGIPLENIFRIEQDYGALNIIEFYDKYPVVKLVNFRPQSTKHRLQTEGGQNA